MAEKCAVYIIESTSGHFKIGVSHNPERRFRQLTKTKGPFVYDLIYYWWMESAKQAFHVESYMHNVLKNQRVNGEWFTLTSQDLLDIGNNLVGLAIDDYCYKESSVW